MRNFLSWLCSAIGQLLALLLTYIWLLSLLCCFNTSLNLIYILQHLIRCLRSLQRLLLTKRSMLEMLSRLLGILLCLLSHVIPLLGILGSSCKSLGPHSLLCLLLGGCLPLQPIFGLFLLSLDLLPSLSYGSRLGIPLGLFSPPRILLDLQLVIPLILRVTGVVGVVRDHLLEPEGVGCQGQGETFVRSVQCVRHFTFLRTHSSHFR